MNPLDRPHLAGCRYPACRFHRRIADHQPAPGDDPAYFGGYLNENFVPTFDTLPALDAQQAWQLARNSIDASFAGAADKARWAAELDAAFRTARTGGDEVATTSPAAGSGSR